MKPPPNKRIDYQKGNNNYLYWKWYDRLIANAFVSLFSDVHVSYTREKFEDFGGYADPKDVKRPEKYN